METTHRHRRTPGRRLAPASALGALAALAAAAALAAPAPASPPAPASAPATVAVLVRERAPETDAAERLVRASGGEVTRALGLIDGFAARVPRAALPALRAAPAIQHLWHDAPVRPAMAHESGLDVPESLEYDDDAPNAVWPRAIRLAGEGDGGEDDEDEGGRATVALLDTGVTRVPDLEDRVVARADLTPDHDGVDRYGHGTHMAGVIAGNGASSDGQWPGVAPDARLVSVKVAGWDGAADVSTVIAGLQWIAANRARFRIRVLALAFGTDGRQSYRVDPLDYAVERLAAAGVLVVAAAGNQGPGAATVTKPGDDPFVLTVGAADLRETATTADDVVAGFSSRGPTQDGFAKPDLVAPGTTIVSNRSRGSTVDAFRPAARVGDRHFKGTGTSQAAAIVAGVAARMFAAEPELGVDEAKAALIGTAGGALAGREGAGAGLVDAAAAVEAARSRRFRDARPHAGVAWSSGLGSIEAARGSGRVYADLDGNRVAELVAGEIDVLGAPWDLGTLSQRWGPLTAVQSGWEVRPWTGPTWGGAAWEPQYWGAGSYGEAGWTAKYWGAKYWGTDTWN